MITAEELRIGNSIQYFIGDDGYEWDFTTVDHQDISWAANKNQHFNSCHRAIPITPELLVKYGFDKFSQNSSWELPNCPINITFFKSEFEVRLKSVSVYFRKDKHQNTDIKYLHQLQNLYFSLMGKELTLKK